VTPRFFLSFWNSTFGSDWSPTISLPDEVGERRWQEELEKDRRELEMLDVAFDGIE